MYLGAEIDPAEHARRDAPVLYSASQLTTHGVIVGMTGSGKTGQAVVLLEEALLQGVPVIVLDPKGDMGNLLLTFPALDGGRLVFLGFELITRRRPNEKVEAVVHMVGLLFLLGVIVLVTFRDVMG